MICIPVFNRETDSQVEGCIEIEFKPKHYLSSNPFVSGASYSGRDFKLDLVAKESLEIFSNQLRVSLERLNVLKRYQNKKGIRMGNEISPVRQKLSELSPLSNPF